MTQKAYKLTLFSFFFAALALHAGGTLQIPDKVPFEKGLNVPDKIEEQCNVQSQLSNFIAQYAKGSYDKVSTEGGSGHKLVIEINDISGAGGGAFSGPKIVQVKGKLMDGGNVLGSFVIRRHSMGGVMSGLRGTCAILERCCKAIGQDIGEFLKNPSMDARLGDAK